MRVLLIFLLLLLCGGCEVVYIDEQPVFDDAAAVLAMYPPVDQRQRFKNRPDAQGQGSCVQASISLCGLQQNIEAAEMLLVDSKYGPPVLGGSWPERVKEYCQQRNIPIVSVEGAQTLEFIEAACRNGRFAAITYGQAHMICCVGVSEDGQTFWIWDNNDPEREPQPVDRRTFEYQHRVYGGGWCVILLTPAPVAWRAPEKAEWMP